MDQVHPWVGNFLQFGKKTGNFHTETVQRFVGWSSSFVEACGWNEECCFLDGLFRSKGSNARRFMLVLILKWPGNRAREFWTSATCSVLVLLCTCWKHAVLKWSMVEGDVLQNRIRLLLNCSYSVFSFLQELDYYCAMWNVTFFSELYSCIGSGLLH